MLPDIDPGQIHLWITERIRVPRFVKLLRDAVETRLAALEGGGSPAPSYVDLPAIPVPANPAAGWRLYTDTADGHLEARNATGTVVNLDAPSGGPGFRISCVIQIGGDGHVTVLPGATGVAVGRDDAGGGAAIVADGTTTNAIQLTFLSAFGNNTYAFTGQGISASYFGTVTCYPTPSAGALPESITFFVTGANGFVDPAVGFSGAPITLSVFAN